MPSRRGVVAFAGCAHCVLLLGTWVPVAGDGPRGFDLPALCSAMLIPFPDLAGGWMDHGRVKVFPPLTDRQGHRLKYLQRPRSAPRLYFPLPSLAAVVAGCEPAYFVEGEKKALSLAQLGLPVVGFCGLKGGTPPAGAC
jgi:hypothetical protein